MNLRKTQICVAIAGIITASYVNAQGINTEDLGARAARLRAEQASPSQANGTFDEFAGTDKAVKSQAYSWSISNPTRYQENLKNGTNDILNQTRTTYNDKDTSAVDAISGAIKSDGMSSNAPSTTRSSSGTTTAGTSTLSNNAQPQTTFSGNARDLSIRQTTTESANGGPYNLNAVTAAAGGANGNYTPVQNNQQMGQQGMQVGQQVMMGPNGLPAAGQQVILGSNGVPMVGQQVMMGPNGLPGQQPAEVDWARVITATGNLVGAATGKPVGNIVGAAASGYSIYDDMSKGREWGLKDTMNAANVAVSIASAANKDKHGLQAAAQLTNAAAGVANATNGFSNWGFGQNSNNGIVQQQQSVIPPGSQIIQQSNGQQIIVQPNGQSYQMPQGAQIMQQPNGQTIMVTPQQQYQMQPQVVQQSGQGMIYPQNQAYQMPQGVQIMQQPNGQQIMIQNGQAYQMPQGTQIIQQPNGQLVAVQNGQNNQSSVDWMRLATTAGNVTGAVAGTTAGNAAGAIASGASIYSHMNKGGEWGIQDTVNAVNIGTSLASAGNNSNKGLHTAAQVTNAAAALANITNGFGQNNIQRPQVPNYQTQVPQTPAYQYQAPTTCTFPVTSSGNVQTRALDTETGVMTTKAGQMLFVDP